MTKKILRCLAPVLAVLLLAGCLPADDAPSTIFTRPGYWTDDILQTSSTYSAIINTNLDAMEFLSKIKKPDLNAINTSRPIQNRSNLKCVRINPMRIVPYSSNSNAIKIFACIAKDIQSYTASFINAFASQPNINTIDT